MKRWLAAPVLAVMCTLALACGDDPTNPGTPADTTLAGLRVAGDSQVQFLETELINRLSIQLVDRAGNPVAQTGVPVGWSVLAGGGVLATDGSVTTTGGVATARWTMGAEPGTNRARVTVGTLQPVEFTARAARQGPIVFVSSRHAGFRGDDFEGYPGDLFAMNEDGSDVIRIVTPRPEINYSANPAWAPNGEILLFSLIDPRPAGGIPGPVSLGVFWVSATGFKEEQVPRTGFPPEVDFLEDPAWAPDNVRIVAHSTLDRQLYTMNFRTTTNLTKLVGFGESAHSPSWSPDGSRIAFACSSGGKTDICLVDSDGGGLENLTNGPAIDGEPDWAPDGSQILFSRDSLLDGGIWVMNADGSGERQLFAGRATAPSWAPDGTRFLMTWTPPPPAGRTDIYMVDVTTLETINLTNAGSLDRQAIWRR
ncbi:MAG: PD40 domain-containing protein [Gemmatimonadetes bacterium]|nr:PD40 domain-containing protein [Gemmatimonadota bacterium]